MLTIAKVTDAEAATQYYEQADDYYSEEGAAPSAWLGNGAAVAGLSGAVDSERFRALLAGEMPDGSKMHVGGEESRRAGTDLTFSAPKSVSMQALVFGDRRLIEAHETAVTRALAYIEEHHAAFRATQDGETTSLLSGNLLVASFRHDLSRSADPQLHTHAVLINATQRPDGLWRALDAKALYTYQKLLGAFYRAELALEVQALGYGVRLTHDDGRFELSHISDYQVAGFSSRSSAIEAALAKLSKTRATASAKEREFAALGSRQAKGTHDRKALFAVWQEKARALGVSFTAQPGLALSNEARKERIDAGVNFAVDHLIEREAVISLHDVRTWALGRATGAGRLADIEQSIERRVSAGALIREGDKLTTVAAQQQERSILDIEKRTRASVERVGKQLWFGGMEDARLNAEQWNAARLILTTTNTVVGVQGKAGTGKTTMLAEVRDQCLINGYIPVGLAPSAAAARELEKTGIESATIAAFVALANKGLSSKSIVVVDEAGMVSTKDMLAILEAAEAASARVVLVGDTRQLKAVQAGMPFSQLINGGMATVDMVTVRRQINRVLKDSVELASEGKTAESLRLIEQHVTEIPHALDRYVAVANRYADLSGSDRRNTLVVCGLNTARETINQLIRERLGFRDVGVPMRVLVSKDMTQAQSKSSLSYQPGDVIQAQRKYESLGIKAGETATVVLSSGGRVQIERQDGVIVEWRPALMPHFSAFTVAEREIAVGETLRVTANDYFRELVNGERVTVAEINRRQGLLYINKANGARLTVNIDRPLHIEHGYCSTIHSAQGQTCERVIIEADARSATAHEASYYVALSRARSEVALYTDDRALLPQAMARESSKTTALSLARAGSQESALER